MTAHPPTHCEAELILRRAAEDAGLTEDEMRRRHQAGTLNGRLRDLMLIWGDA